jgi:hypothetical protein
MHLSSFSQRSHDIFADSPFPNILKEYEEYSKKFFESSKEIESIFDPNKLNVVDVHERQLMYASALLSVSSIKQASLSQSIIEFINKSGYISFCLLLRASIELIALQYYYYCKMKIIFDKMIARGVYDKSDLIELTEIQDKFLRGSRFDWAEFLGGHPNIEAISSDKKILRRQVNIMTCIDKLSKDERTIRYLYDLLSDVAHPSMGSNLSIMSVKYSGVIEFNYRNHDSIGKSIFRFAFPLYWRSAMRVLPMIYKVLTMCLELKADSDFATKN